jgi:hypothetical protein
VTARQTIIAAQHRDLEFTAYDGTLIRTPWFVGDHFILSAQCRQAEYHREKVRAYLAASKARRLR